MPSQFSHPPDITVTLNVTNCYIIVYVYSYDPV